MAPTVPSTMAHLRRAHLGGRTREMARTAAGAEALAARSRAARRRDLRSMLAFAARRRLGRAYALPSAPAHGGPAATPTPTVSAEGALESGVVESRVVEEDAVKRAVEDATLSTSAAPRLIQRIDVAADLLRLILSRPPGFDYRPGQHVKMGVPGVMRTYSLASAPHEPHLEFFTELFPGGRLSERLRTVRPGAAMALGDRAKGDLAVDERYPNQLLIGTVTGVAPYVSFLRQHVRHNAALGRHHFVVLHGASFAGELGYAEELTELARQHPGTLTYVPTVSRPEDPRNAGWTGARGRVETQVEGLLTRLKLSAVDTAIFACGHPAMVKNVADAFRRRRYTVHTEPFD